MKQAVVGTVLLSLLAAQALAETSTSNKAAVIGLAGIATLESTTAGQAALSANFKKTGDIQSGKAQQHLLASWSDQQQQALRDAFITRENGNELADGLGTMLGGKYQAATTYTRTGPSAGKQGGSMSALTDALLQYAFGIALNDGGAGKSFFGNGKINGAAPSDLPIKPGDATDVFGKAYGAPAGASHPSLCQDNMTNPNGNSRPFQTEPNITPISGQDFFGDMTYNKAYLCGPTQPLQTSSSYPSGHTTYGYTESLLLALLVPERYPQMVVRGAEYGNNRIVLGAHYTMDVLGGRTLAMYDLAHLLANTPDYVAKPGAKGISDFQKALNDARAELAKALSAACGDTVAACAKQDKGRFANLDMDRAFYNDTQTYELGVVNAEQAKGVEDVAKLAPEARYLLTAAYPYLSDKQATDILTETEGPGGGFLDNGTAFGVYSRLNLFEASLKALALAPKAAH